MNSEHTSSVAAGSLAHEAVAEHPRKAGPAHGNASAKQMRERVVLVSIGLVTAAAAAALYGLFDFSLPGAVLSGGGVWTALLLLHMQAKKNMEIQALRVEVARLESARLAQQITESANIVSARRSAAAAPAAPAPAAAAPAKTAPVYQSGDGEEGDAFAITGGPAPHPRWEAAPASAPESTLAVPHSATPATAATGNADPLRDQWAFRPKDATAKPAASRREPRDLHSTQASSLDTDLEIVQRKIKALADEVNAAELDRDRSAAVKPANVPVTAAIEKSVGALKVTADSMRETLRERSAAKAARKASMHQAQAQYLAKPQPQAQTAPQSAAQSHAQSSAQSSAEYPGSQPISLDLMIPATAERIAVSTPEAVLTGRSLDIDLPVLPAIELVGEPPRPPSRLAEISAAIAGGGMDVFLSPIVALQTHQVSHYDVTVRLKSADGAYIDDAEQQLQLTSTDVLALFDTERLKCATGLANRLNEHNKPGSLLSAVNGPSLTNGEFLETFARAYEERDSISNQLVLTFTQADVELFSVSAWQALSNMHAFGFRFAVAQIDHVAMDFTVLAKRGFSFLRLDAKALLNGLPARERFVPSDELCKMLAGAGMTLVADAIEDEAVRARVFGFGVLLGQGSLFGGARQVKLDPLPSSNSAAA